MEGAMSSRANLDADFDLLMADSTALADENDRLRRINSQMLAALESALPILQDASAPAVDLDSAKDSDRQGPSCHCQRRPRSLNRWSLRLTAEAFPAPLGI
jgi:hypothetical protein